jgi:hypothetical protein
VTSTPEVSACDAVIELPDFAPVPPATEYVPFGSDVSPVDVPAEAVPPGGAPPGPPVATVVVVGVDLVEAALADGITPIPKPATESAVATAKDATRRVRDRDLER